MTKSLRIFFSEINPFNMWTKLLCVNIVKILCSIFLQHQFKKFFFKIFQKVHFQLSANLGTLLDE